ncbi:MAG: DegV family protein [Acidobacteriota bacterium]
MRPAVLIVDPDDVRRQALSQGLAAKGYEAVPAMGSAEGLKFAQGLGPSVIVAPAALMGFGDAKVLDSFAVRDHSMKRTLLLLGEAAEEGQVSEEVLFLPISDLSYDEMIRRIRLVLVSREVGVESDVELASLIGDLSLMPLLELVRALHRCLVTGHLEVENGTILLERGDVVAARAGQARGVKAFCRLSGLVSGPFHVYLKPSGVAREIDLEVPELVLRAIEELQVEQPDPQSTIRILAPPGEEPSSDVQQTLLDTIEGCGSVGQLLDALPATDGRIVQMLRSLQDRGWVRLEKAQIGVAVVTDSTADLPADLARQHGILTVPLSVVFGKDSFRDGVDIQPRDFYKLLETSDEHPSTEPPPEAEFYEHYRDLILEQDIVSVHISSAMSKTASHAREAAMRGSRSFDHLPAERQNIALEVVDSKTVSIGVGLQALLAARMARRGVKVSAIAQRLRAMTPRIHLLFAVDTFDFLVRGGRIGKARATMGRLLGIKPILGVSEGEVTAIDRVRGGRKAHPRIVELVAQRIDPSKPIIAGVAHARAPVWADRLRALLEAKFEVKEMLLTTIGPVVGAHTGPGCVGCIVFQPDDDEWPLVAELD